jgi:hypothetical protein
MKKATRDNFKEFIEDLNNQGQHKFPQGFTIEIFESLTMVQRENIIKRVYAFMGYKGYADLNTTMTKTDFKRIGDFKFSNTLYRIMKDKTDTLLKKIADQYKQSIPAPSWSEIPTPMQNNFKKWLGSKTKDYDEKFSVRLFDELPDKIKVEFYYTLAQKFGVDNYEDLKTFKRSSNGLIMGVKKLKISEEIQEAIYDVIPVEGLIQIIKKSDMDGTWSGKSNSEIAKGITQEEIDAAREQRKTDKKLAKLKARVKSMMSLEQYTVTLKDPDFDRSMFETILNRMENETAFKDTWYDSDSKEIIKLIVNHPLATTQDLLRIKKMKSKRFSNGPVYASIHLNTAMAGKSDIPITELMKMIKLAQYDLKISTLQRKDLSPADKNIVLEYAVKQHSHMPEQMEEIFKASGNPKGYETYKDTIIENLYKKYTKATGWYGKANGLKFLEVLERYGWVGDVDEQTKEGIAKLIAKAYDDGRISKERIIKVMDSLSDMGIDYLSHLHSKTGDEGFLPVTVRDMFIF